MKETQETQETQTASNSFACTLPCFSSGAQKVFSPKVAKEAPYTILHAATCSEPFFVINKKAGVSTCPLNERDKKLTALGELLKAFPDLAKVKGKKSFEAGLLHRLDTPTSGLLLCAATQEFFDALSKEQEKGAFIKTYSALCESNPNTLQTLFDKACDAVVVYNKKEIAIDSSNKAFFSKLPIASLLPIKVLAQSRFRAFGKKGALVRPVMLGEVCHKALTKTVYETAFVIKALAENQTTFPAASNQTAFPVAKKASCDKSAASPSLLAPLPNLFVQAKLSKGFRHQVRAHLAFLGLPIVGDGQYNEVALSKNEAQFCFKAVALDFEWQGKKWHFEI